MFLSRLVNLLKGGLKPYLGLDIIEPGLVHFYFFCVIVI